MSNDLTLIQKLVAVELGCEWELLAEWPGAYAAGQLQWQIAVDQSFGNACRAVSREIEIRLTSKPWDWPVCERERVPIWSQKGAKLDPSYRFWQYFESRALCFCAHLSSGVPYFNFVAANPLNPDEVPPSDWEPTGRRSVK